MLRTHGTTALRSGRALIETDYRPGDRGPGLLAMRLEDQETGESVEASIRLDPWSGHEYRLIEPVASYVVICGAQAIVAIDASTLAWLSSVALEYEEGERIGSPWHVEIEGRLVLATERRVWCLDERGVIQWMWSCSASERDSWISGQPVAEGDRVRLPLRTFHRDFSVELRLGDGLPISD